MAELLERCGRWGRGADSVLHGYGNIYNNLSKLLLACLFQAALLVGDGEGVAGKEMSFMQLSSTLRELFF